jgi:hypothetical protein
VDRPVPPLALTFDLFYGKFAITDGGRLSVALTLHIAVDPPLGRMQGPVQPKPAGSAPDDEIAVSVTGVAFVL